MNDSASHDKIATRLAQILLKFNNGERLSLDELVAEFNVSERTIKRDLNERLSFLPIKSQGKFYELESYALGKLNYKDIKLFATLSGIKHLYPVLDDKFIVDLLNQKTQQTMLIAPKHYQNAKYEDFELIAAAILNQNQISFTYKNKQRVVNPYKLFNNSIWYLIAVEDEKIKTFNFSNILSLKKLESKFNINKTVQDMIDSQNSQWFSNSLLKAKFIISKAGASYFLRKPFFKNQEIKTFENGDLEVSVACDYEDEILNFIKSWIPYARLVEPLELKDKLKIQLDEYVKNSF